MGLQRTLLERIRDPDPPNERVTRVSTRDIFDSVLTNLQNLLNTTHGNCLTDERYGLPHMTTVRNTMPHSVGAFEAAIRTSIEKTEPRLRNVRGRHTPMGDSGMELRFAPQSPRRTGLGGQGLKFRQMAAGSAVCVQRPHPFL